jgi:diguanylate cyclase (GGDEF)-like protein/PAS domain S-box-containing protein
MGWSCFRSLDDTASLRQLVRNLKEAIYITSESGVILDANPAMLEIFGLKNEEELQNYLADELWADPEARKRELKILKEKGSVREFEVNIRRPDGEIRTVLDTAYMVKDPLTGEMLLHGILVDITERKRLEMRLLEQSTRDPLTGCYNRRYLDEFELRESRGTWGCIVIDVDNFKRLNDEYGHHAGDEALVGLARFLMQQVRAGEGIVRMGGDEFLVLLSDSNPALTKKVADRLRRNGKTQAPVSFTMGWASRTPGESLDKTIRRADGDLLSVRVSRCTPNRRKREQKK